MTDGPGDVTYGSRRAPRPELVVRFWTLVLLAKLAVLLLGIGVLVAAFTGYTAAGVGLVGVALLVGVRWAMLFRRGPGSA